MTLAIFLAATALFVGSTAQAQFYGQPCAPPVFAPTALPSSTFVDGNIVRSLIDTLQLFMVTNLLDEKVKPIGLPKPCPETIVPCQNIIPPCTVPACGKVPFLAPPLSPCDPISILPVFPSYEPPCPCNSCAYYASATACNPCSQKPCQCNCEETEYKCLDLVLPPMFPQLPCGLGYLPAAAPMVAAAYSGCCSSTGCNCNLPDSCIPIVSPCSNTIIAAPVCPDIACLVKPIIL